MSAFDEFRKKESFINKNQTRFERDIARLQNQLWELISRDYIPDFNITETGNLALNNIQKSIALDGIFQKFTQDFQKSVFSRFANELLQLTDFSEEYFIQSGFDKKVVAKINEQTQFISKAIGIDKEGKVIKGSYLDRLAQAQGVRDELKDYVTNQVSVKTNLKDFQRGFKDLVAGNKRLGIEGKLVKYHQQFSYDTFSQISQSADNFFADKLDLNFFIYEGTIIKTSRCFCIKRKGKVFHRSDLDNWKNDSQLLGDPNTYNPLTDRGRWNCRHLYRWISDGLAESRGYSKREANAILKKGCPKKNKKK